MKRILNIETKDKAGEEVLLEGWIERTRKHGKLVFFDVRDRSCLIQVVVNNEVSEKAFILAENLRAQDVIKLIGKVNKRPENAINKNLETGEVEIEAKEIEVLSKAEVLPFDMGKNDLDLELPTLLDNRALSLRHQKVSAVFKIQKTLTESFRNTLTLEGFTEIFVPTLVPVATEGGSEVFSVDYYDKKAYLAQSPQQYKQIMVSVFERVFTIAHAYRAEPSVTTRHLSEYISLDAEMGFIDSYSDLMDMVEKVIKGMFNDVRTKNRNDLKIFNIDVPRLENKFPRVKMREAQEIIFKRTGIDHRKEPDLDPNDERELCLWAKEENNSPFIFITHYPTSKRPFYTMPDPENPEYTLSFDLLGINEEWVTGGQRINNYEQLIKRVKEKGNNPKNFEIYLQAFRFGMPPEGGFAMGLERITKDILGLSNVREASLFPRDMERVDERFSKIKEKDKRD